MNDPADDAAVAWCQPMDCGKHTPRKFIVRFEDADQGEAHFDNEREARAFFEKASTTWNCWLFATLPLLTHPAKAVDVEAVKRLRTMADSLVVDPTPLNALGQFDATYGDLRALLNAGQTKETK